MSIIFVDVCTLVRKETVLNKKKDVNEKTYKRTACCNLASGWFVDC